MSTDTIRKTGLQEAGLVLDHSNPKQANDEVVVVLDIPLHENGDKTKCQLSSTSSLKRVIQVLIFYTMNLDKNHRVPSGPVQSGYARFFLSFSTKAADPDAVYEELRNKLQGLSITPGRAVFPHQFQEQGLTIDRSLQ
ncbi:uncharacterized protein LDX57_011572 [Aspergillus melleus]|uniref:uncharacterized protein n=1 Tax=Aspergillus melleus TaxID=138277 RepID=UPI001E8D5DA9|nr:uncharacterized protein LDX57_011572 [Aspergillus melleus]KAH8433936.1 hypothetical protein LDX57_011572 [Aspergillus melleus]